MYRYEYVSFISSNKKVYKITLQWKGAVGYTISIRHLCAIWDSHKRQLKFQVCYDIRPCWMANGYRLFEGRNSFTFRVKNQARAFECLIIIWGTRNPRKFGKKLLCSNVWRILNLQESAVWISSLVEILDAYSIGNNIFSLHCQES
jgi:hypothetical protein